MSENVITVPAIFQRHVGTWKGEYIKTDTTGHFLRSFTGTFTVRIERNTYKQVNYYQYSDGSDLTLNFSGEFIGGILRMSSTSYSEFSAIAWDSGQETIGFKVRKTHATEVIEFMETINLLDENHRVRSTQAFKNGKFDGISFIEEVRL